MVTQPGRRRWPLDPDRARAATARTVVVMGPPAAGKTTWVAEHARPGDVRIDLDLLAVALGVDVDPATYPLHVRHVAVGARDAAIYRATQLRQRVTVWLVHSDPTPAQLADYQAAGCELVTVDPGRDIVLDRCARLRSPTAAAAAVAWYDGRPEASAKLNASRVW